MPVDDPLFNIVLWQPQIPNNTGNIGRTAMGTNCRLHLIHPLGFDLSEKACRRAGMDYWKHVDYREHASWDAYLSAERPSRLWLYTARATRAHWEADLRQGDHLLFGREEDGVSPGVIEWVTNNQGADHLLALPMIARPEARSLNLATAAACAVYEGLRQCVRATGRYPGAYDR